MSDRGNSQDNTNIPQNESGDDKDFDWFGEVPEN